MQHRERKTRRNSGESWKKGGQFFKDATDGERKSTKTWKGGGGECEGKLLEWGYTGGGKKFKKDLKRRGIIEGATELITMDSGTGLDGMERQGRAGTTKKDKQIT